MPQATRKVSGRINSCDGNTSRDRARRTYSITHHNISGITHGVVSGPRGRLIELKKKLKGACVIKTSIISHVPAESIQVLKRNCSGENTEWCASTIHVLIKEIYT